MIVTIDTNVLFAALYSRLGASYQILKLIINEKIQLALTSSVFIEYNEILKNDENLKLFGLTKKETEDILDLLMLLSNKHDIYFKLRPNLIDESDNMFIECAFVSDSNYLITSNIKHFTTGQLKGFKFRVITLGDFCKKWRKNNE